MSLIVALRLTFTLSTCCLFSHMACPSDAGILTGVFRLVLLSLMICLCHSDVKEMIGLSHTEPRVDSVSGFRHHPEGLSYDLFSYSVAKDLSMSYTEMMN